MDSSNDFVLRSPYNSFLSTIVESYFFIDIEVSQLSLQPEFIIPFPRITFGYFFNLPFSVTNLTTNESIELNMAISRISTQQILVQPTKDKIKIIGAHVKPFALAYLTKQPINSLPWLINIEELFGETAVKFRKTINVCSNLDEMFEEVEKVFLDNMLVRDLSIITKAIELIETTKNENIAIKEIACQLSITERTLRNHFYEHIGCSPKEYLQIVKMKKVASQLKHSQRSLTEIAYDNSYCDQAHFINEMKKITGHTPNELKKKIPHFRFLQF